MKRSLSLVFATLLFVVLGCSLSSLTGKKDDAPTPVADKPSTTSSPASTTSSPSTTSDAGSANLSIDNFNKIKLGMSYEDVKGVMGSDGNNTASSKVGSYESKSYQWKGERFASVRTRFRNGKLVYKSQSGLTKSKDGSADINQAKFNKINTDMSYAQVKEIVGSEGEMISVSQLSTTTLTSYKWNGAKYANIRVSFKNDKLTNKYQSGLK